MAKRKRFKWMKIIISKRADKYIRSLARRTEVTPSKILCLLVVMELDRLDRLEKQSPVVEDTKYPIRPKDIDLQRVCLISIDGRKIKGLVNTFGHAETEWAAEFIIKLCQKAGKWLALSHEELDKAYVRTARGRWRKKYDAVYKMFLPPGMEIHLFWFYDLIDGGWVIKGKDGKYRVTEAFIKRCYERHPAKQKRS